jgi:opine dehydrogenase
MTCIAVCGGGSLAHATVAVLGAQADVEVRILTRQPTRWSRLVRAIYLDLAEVAGKVAIASNKPSEVIPGAQIVILCVPSCAREQTLAAIAPFLDRDTWIGCVPGFGGFEWQSRSVIGPEAKVFGLQRVPYVRKTISYGEAVWISGIRPRLVLGALPASEAPTISRLIEQLLGIPTDPIANYLPITLSASNSLFHPARIYSAFASLANKAVLSEQALFYEEWDDTASRTYLALDGELQAICSKIPADMTDAQPIRLHYGIDDEAGLTRRIRSLRSLRDRYLPLLRTDTGYVPDVHSYYFSEDIPFGLVIVKGVAEIVGVATPMIDTVIGWAQRAMGRDYIRGDRLAGKDAALLPIPAHFGISNAAELVARAL